jgi:hypothetical protein
VTYEGRLELTWTNNHLRLLAHATAPTNGCSRRTTESLRGFDKLYVGHVGDGHKRMFELYSQEILPLYNSS